LNAWKIEGGDGGGPSAPMQQDNFNQEASPTSNSNSNAQNIDSREDLDDLPF
jgi:hypothetical protein